MFYCETEIIKIICVSSNSTATKWTNQYRRLLPQNLNHFMMIVGKPGSSKTTLLLNLICKRGKMYNKKLSSLTEILSARLGLPTHRAGPPRVAQATKSSTLPPGRVTV